MNLRQSIIHECVFTYFVTHWNSMKIDSDDVILSRDVIQFCQDYSIYSDHTEGEEVAGSEAELSPDKM